MSADNIDTRAPYVRLRVGRRSQFVVLAAATLDAPDGDWTLEALCAQTDPDVFYPVKGGPPVTPNASANAAPSSPPAASGHWITTNATEFGAACPGGTADASNTVTPCRPSQAAARP